ncbi:MAG: hypothetical protein V1684_02170 [bacterium]
MYNLTKQEEKIFKSLKNPAQIQDFLNKIPINFDYHKDTCLSPRMVLKKNKCHCIEGAILAALALRFQGQKPLIVHLKTAKGDDDHVIAVFKKDKKWGAISKTNHGVLRYREPVYDSIRELAMSYFHEYTDKKGNKTLRSFSVPLDLSRFDKKGWATSEEDLWYIDAYLDKIRHFNILAKNQARHLRKADMIERKIGNVTEWRFRKK